MAMVVGPAILSGLASGFSVGAGFAISFAGFSWSSFGTSLVLGGLSKALTPKAKKSNAGAATITSNGWSTTIKQPIMNREIVYGEARQGGGIVFLGTSSSNMYLHVVIALAGHEVQEIGEVWFDDYSIAPDHLDGSGNVTSGRYSGLARIKKYLGTGAQTADSDLVAECAEWTTDHKLAGVAYIYVRLKWDQDKFSNGMPNISAWIRGKKVYDPRTSTTYYSNNAALVVNSYLVDSTYGLNASQTEVDSTYLTAAANSCDEFVTVTDYPLVVTSVDASGDLLTLSSTETPTLYFQTGDRVRLTTTSAAPGGLATGTDYYVICYQRKDTLRIKLASSYANALAGTAINITDAGTGTHTITKKAEPRFTAGIVLDSGESLRENIVNLLSAMAGMMVYSGGSFRILAGTYQTPTVYYDLNDIISPINVQTKLSRRERFNTVSGTYISPINDGQPSDYPSVRNSTYITEDGETIIKQIDLPATQRPHTAQRIAKIELEKSRQEISWQADFNLSAFQVQAGDTAYFTIDRYGWTNKVFEIMNWTLSSREEDGVHVPYIRMTMRETASGVYDWSNGEETSVDLAPNTTLPSPFTVAALTGVSIDTETINTQSGDYLYKIMARWDAVTDNIVLNGGRVEIGFKKSTDSEWRPTFYVPADVTFAEVTVASELNVEYDIRLRVVNQVGVRSGYTQLLNFVVGSSGGVGSTEDWGDWTSSPATTDDYGDWTSSPSSTDDWGYFA